MTPNDFAVFAVALFSALTLLLKWKRRRDEMVRRVNRGLRSYVTGRSLVRTEGNDELIVAEGL